MFSPSNNPDCRSWCQNYVNDVRTRVASFLDYDARNKGCAALFWKSTLELCYPMFKTKGKSLVDMITLLVERGLFNRENHGPGLLDWADFFAGTAALSRACLKKSRRGVALDWLFQERAHDVLTSQGFRLYMDVVCSLSLDALAWFGIQCSSFVQICVSVSCRGEDNDWLGDEGKEFVRSGNLMMVLSALLMLVAHLLKTEVLLEQPVTSVLPLCPTMRNVLSFIGTNRSVTYLGAFDGPSVKPIQVFHNHVKYQALVRERPIMLAARELVTRSESGQYTGIPDALEQSGAYPLDFAQAVADIWRP